MHSTMMIPGFEGVEVRKTEERGGCLYLHVQMLTQTQVRPSCQARTRRVHDYRVQKVQYLKWFERLTYLFYRKRRYVCDCGKRFSERKIRTVISVRIVSIIYPA